MFELLMLASFALIVFSQSLPERQPADNQKGKDPAQKHPKKENASARTNHIHHCSRPQTKPPCRIIFGRAV